MLEWPDSHNRSLSSLLYISPGTNMQLARGVLGWLPGESILPDLLMIMVVEDDPIIQALVDEALCDGVMNRRWLHQARKPSRYCGETGISTGRSFQTYV